MTCSQRMHMVFTYSSVGMTLELTNSGEEEREEEEREEEERVEGKV